MQLFSCVYCGKTKAIRWGGICPDCLLEDRSLLRKAHAILREEGGISLEDMALQLDVSTCRIERWIKEELIHFMRVRDINPEQAKLGTAVDRFLKREGKGAVSKHIQPKNSWPESSPMIGAKKAKSARHRRFAA